MKCYKIFVAVLIFTIAVPSLVFSQENNFNKMKSEEIQKMSFLLGDWKFNTKYLQRDGTFGSGEARSSVVLTTGRKAIADYYCSIKPDGSLDTNGVTIRTYDERTKKWRMIWCSEDLNFYTIFDGEYVNGEFHFSGKGNEYGKEFLEEVVFYNIKEESYSWKMKRSYDRGKTWTNNIFSYDAVKLK